MRSNIKNNTRLALSLTACFGIAAAGILAARSAAQEAPPTPPGEVGELSDAEAEVLTHGPIHEAFAEPHNTNTEPGAIIDVKPPDTIDEAPPEEMPEGENVVWIPGYWFWDPAEEQFVWVSGLWRDVPPGRRWVPGYWLETEGGYQWISGFWTSDDVQEVSYLPVPPESLEEGPNVEAPSGDYFWVPGVWMWTDNDYRWRPGYWNRAYDDWVWSPARYVWTPYGCVFVDGYWDHQLIHRGVLFAPVSFAPAVYARPHFHFTPSVVIDVGPVLVHLFVSPHHHHYYFGNYYGIDNAAVGIVPWHFYAVRRAWYDPLLTWYEWSYARRNINLVSRLAGWHEHFDRHDHLRPPRTLRDQREFLRRHRDDDRARLAQNMLARPIRDVVEDQREGRRFRRIAEAQRDRLRDAARQIRDVKQQRAELERRIEGRAGFRGVEERRVPRERLKLPEVITTLPARGPEQAEQPRRRSRVPTPDKPPELDGRRTPPERGVERGRPARPADRPGARRPADVPRDTESTDRARRPADRVRRPGEGEARDRAEPRFPRFGVRPREERIDGQGRSRPDAQERRPGGADVLEREPTPDRGRPIDRQPTERERRR